MLATAKCLTGIFMTTMVSKGGCMGKVGYYRCDCGGAYFSDFVYEKGRCFWCGSDVEITSACYKYGGYHFEPCGKLEKVDDVSELVLVPDEELGFFDSDWGGRKRRHLYNRIAFYASVEDSECDIFRCLENGRLYVPCEHELFRFEGYRGSLADVTYVLDRITQENGKWFAEVKKCYPGEVFVREHTGDVWGWSGMTYNSLKAMLLEYYEIQIPKVSGLKLIKRTKNRTIYCLAVPH